jgi:hypothetical protein
MTHPNYSFSETLLQKVFQSIEWHSGVLFESLSYDGKADDPIFVFTVNDNRVVLRYDKQNCILTSVDIKLFFYKVVLDDFVINGFNEAKKLSEYFHTQFKNRFEDKSGIHFGYNIVGFRIKQMIGENRIWLVYTLNIDPSEVDDEVYRECELLVKNEIQIKQIMALRTMLEANLMQGVTIRPDIAGVYYDKPLNYDQLHKLTTSDAKSNQTYYIRYDKDSPLPTQDDFVIIGEVIVFMSEMIHGLTEKFNKEDIERVK